jgi:protein TonB
VSKAPLRVGGRVKPPRAIAMPAPVYPEIARAARIQGDVVVDAVIDTNGNIVQMKLVSGHPLLVGAAMEALRRWKYEPTYLDEQPVSIELNVTIHFSMQ